MNVCQHRNCKTFKFHWKIPVQIMTLLPVLNTFTFDTEEYCLNLNYKVNDAKALKNLSHHCSLI